MSTILTPGEAGDLIAEHLGLDLSKLKAEKARKEEAILQARLEAQKLAEKQAERRKLEAAHGQFMLDWQTGAIIVSIDGKLQTKPGTLCKSGTPDVDALVTQVRRLRGSLQTGFIGISGHPGARQAATISRDVQCTCGRTHRVKIFVTADRPKL